MLRGIGRLRAKPSSSGPSQTDLAAWYRKGVGITDVANAVSAWADQSGNTGRDLVQATGASQPTKQGDGSILFDGTADHLKAPFTLNQPASVYLRMKQVTWTAARNVFDGGVGLSILQQTNGGASPQLRLFAGNATASNSALAVDTWGSVAAVLNGASSVLQINATTVSGDAGATNLGGLTVGSSSGGSNFSNIQVAEILVYSVAHDATQRTAVMNYLATIGV